MLVSWKWLSSLVDIKSLTPAEAGEQLTMAGLELEGVQDYGSNPALDSVIVAKIESIEPHPNADKLVVCQVNTGSGLSQIVCGATNMKAGDKVPLAQPGTVMPGDEPFKIKKSKLRGVESQGMLCSARELQLSEEHEGLLILPPALEVGEPVLEALDLADTVLDLSLTPNRPDALSHIGASRDLVALTGGERSWPRAAELWRLASRGEDVDLGELDVEGLKSAGAVGDLIRVDLQDPEGCPRYAAAVMTGLTVGPSPAWMRQRLMAIGQRPINNLVDMTNLALNECGQPMHAFDLDKLQGGVLEIRRARRGETIVTIDDVERTLTEADLVIADGAGPVAIAGVMGGRDSAVSASTTRIVIECANFNPTMVRKTARRLGMHTESSHRFERGVDPNGVAFFIRRAIDLTAQTQVSLDNAEAALADGIIDVYPTPILARTVDMEVTHYARLIGVELATEDMIATLDALDLVTTLEGDVLRVHVPTFRPDIERAVDVIEEIARIKGLASVPAVLPPGLMGFSHDVRQEAVARQETILPRERELAVRRLREILLGRGFREAVNFSFVHSAELDNLGFGPSDPRRYAIKVRNPISVETDVMRTTLTQGLLSNLKHNHAHQSSDVSLFEVGRVFLRQTNDAASLSDDVGGARWGTHVESMHIAGLICGTSEAHFTGVRAADAFDLVGVSRDTMQAITRQPVTVTPLTEAAAMLHPYAAGDVRVKGERVGWIGALHPDLLERYGIDGEVLAFEIDVDRVMELRRPLSKMTAIPRFPSSQRDFALTVDASMPYGRLEEAIAAFGDPRIIDATLFDVYEGEQLEAGKKSLAFRLTLQDPEGTLGEEQLTTLQSRLVAHLTETLGGTLR